MPFGSFKTVDYTYVPKHNLQVIGQTYDYLQNRHDVAVAQESELKKQIGQLELNAQEDEFKQMLVNNIESKIQDASQKGVSAQTAEMPLWQKLIFVVGIAGLLLIDQLFFGGAILHLLLILFLRGGGRGGGGGFGGGSGGGGGSSRRW